ncbi:5-hydroxytryptamine receptor 2A-like [Oncorhynchus kisutch]|uniref:5-hydroxytryptamine receptor 2A-like n=1 Tax=Oncorhynchus kisutch TaxID=8019 RepID=UPI0012DDD640|nr:5-hydroxytryptamine receptor 2A-like [Oncorhynchus kisutch]
MFAEHSSNPAWRVQAGSTLAWLREELACSAHFAGHLLHCGGQHPDHPGCATSFILRSLAVADMLMGFLVMPVSLINILYDYLGPFPRPLCPIWIYLDVLFSTASIMYLCTISLDRYVGICNPIKHSRSNSLSKAKAKIALVWSISIGYHGLDGSRLFGFCGNRIARQPSIDRATLLGTTPRLPAGDSLSLLKQDPSPETLPAVAASNISVSQASSQPVSPAGRQEPGGPGGKPGVAQSIKNERRASKVLGVVFFLFLMMWCPFFITNVLSVLCEDSIISLCNKPVLAVLLNVFVWVGYASSGVNPLVYTLFNRTYRQAFHRYLRCIYHSPPAKSTPAYPVFPVYTVTHILCGKDANRL